MINELAVANFKAFGERQTARLAPITLVYGQNSSGKSSLLQGLLLLAQSISREKEAVTLDARGQHVDLGSFHSFVHAHDRKRQVSLGLAFTPSMDEYRRAVVRPLPRELHELELVFAAERSAGGAGAELASLRLRNRTKMPNLDCTLVRGSGPSSTDLFGWDDMGTHFEWASPQDANSYIAYLRGRVEAASTRAGARDRNRIGEEEWSSIETAIRSARIVNFSGLPSRLVLPSRDRSEIGRDRLPFLFGSRSFQILEGLSYHLLTVFSNLRYLGPLRTHPARHYIVQGGDIVSVGKAGENAPQLLHRNTGIQEQVTAWFGRFEIPYSLSVQDVGDEITGGLIAISLKDLRTGTPVAPSDVGFGIGQLLPILVEGLLADSRAIAVEQPEIHLHPRLQAHLADFFIETSLPEQRDGRRQWIVETHSEALALRVQRRIREGRLKASDVSVLFVEHGQGGSRIVELRLNDRGEFVDEWPGGFFEESYDEIFGAARAAGRDDAPF